MIHVARDASTVVTLTQVTKVAVTTTSMADQADSKVSAARLRGTDLFVRNFEATLSWILDRRFGIGLVPALC
jgi:hypothetical protein